MSLLKNLLSTNKIGPPLNDYGSLYTWGSNASGQLGLNDLVNRSSPVLIDTSSWTQVATRENFSFAIKYDGTLWGWGSNLSGRLGLSDIVHRSSPVQITTLAYSWTSIASAGDINLAIRSDSTLWGWGNNTNGILGLNSTVIQSSPVQVGASSWTAISVNTNSVAAIRSDGGLFTWGNNTVGQLGSNNRVHRSSPVQVGTSSWTTISSGISHMAAIRSDGRLFVWGRGTEGQLGQAADIISRSEPIQVGTLSWTAVSAAFSHTAAIRSDGSLWTWGNNSNGELGLNTIAHRSSPVQVGVSSWSQVDSNVSNTVAIRSDGRLFAWGGNADGQLGQNDLVNRSSPVQIGTSSWTAVAAKNTTAFYAVRSDGSLFAWGANGVGKLGISIDSNVATGRSSPVQIGTNTNWLKVSIAGTSIASVAALTTAGLLWAWGDNTSGQLGQSDLVHRSSPIQIGSLAWDKIALGSSHTVGIKSDGSLWGWGYNYYNQVISGIPTRIAKWTVLPNSIAPYSNQILALDEDYRLHAWGDNYYGILGDGTILDKSSPVQIGTNAYRVVSGGEYASFAIRSDGSLWSWGKNSSGHLGQNSFDARSSPVQIGASSWTQVYSIYGKTFAIRSDGALFAWGDNNSPEELGLGPVSTQVFSWTSVSSGLSSTIAIRSDGSLWAWGDSSLYYTNSYTSAGDLRGNVSSPVQIGASSWTFATAAKNSNNMYAIRSDGGLFAWGNATGGMLGINDTVHRSSPVQIGTLSWSSVSAHTDAVAAIRNTGALFVWGNNTTGELGLGAANNVILSSPVQVGTSSWTAVSVGLSNIAAIRSGGSLFTWGNNTNGELGNNATTTPTTFLTGAVSGNLTGNNTFAIDQNYKLWAIGENASYTLGTNDTVDRSSPVQIGTSSWTQVATTNETGYMIRSDSTLWAIGRNGVGGFSVHRSQPTQISADTWSEIIAEGNATYSGGMAGIRTNGAMFVMPNVWQTVNNRLEFNESPGFWPSFQSDSPIQIGTSSWSQVAASVGTIKAAIRSDGTLWGWGDNTFRTFKSTADTAFSWTTVAASVGSAGDKISFGIRSDGSLWVWGSTTTNSSGIFGLGGTGIMLRSPNQIGASSWTAVATDGRFALAIRNGGSLFAWGDNTNGQLGQSDRVHRSSPVQIGTSSWTQVSAALQSAYAIRSGSGLFTWGQNEWGQLGSNAVTHRSSPVQVGTSSWVAISAGWNGTQAGGNYVAAVRSGGSLFTWGGNHSGTLGQSDRVHRSSPVQVGTSSWTAISSGDGHILALKGPQLFVWGLNDNGQLGSANAGSRSSPIVIGSSSWTAVAALSQASLAIRSDGGLFGWGTGNSGISEVLSSPVQIGTSSWSQVYSGNTASARLSNNMLYQWGKATEGLYSTLNLLSNFSSPVQIGGIIPTYVESPTQISTSSWTQVAVGAYHIVALRTDGGLFTLGRNSSGELGLSDRIHRSSPVQIGTSSWTQIAAGHEGVLSQNTGHAYAIRSDGGLFTWGHSDTGAGTNTDSVYRSAPFQIGSSSWTTISTHGDVGLGILNNGSLFVWGPGSNGNLGQNNQVQYSSPVQITAGQTSWNLANSPIQIGTSSWTAVSAGYSHTAAIRSGSGLFLWGSNVRNQLGVSEANSPATSFNRVRTRAAMTAAGALYVWSRDGINVNRLSSPVQIGGSWSQVSTDYFGYSNFGIKSDGSLWFWGANTAFGLLGNNTINGTISSPVQIGTSSWTQVAHAVNEAGSAAAAAAIRSDGGLFTWGSGGSGQLGSSATAHRSSPVQVASASWAQVSVGSMADYMAAIRDTGALFAWGLNSSGQLGIGSTLTRSSPSGVGASSWSQVVAGQSRTLAIRSGGSLFSWGNNDYGALGLNVGTATINSPVQIGTSSWISVGGGRGTFSSLDDFDVSIAIRSDGGLFAWGFDRNGDTATNVAGNEVSSPVQIGTSSWTAVASNGSVVLRSDGKLWGWGNNEFGQLAITPTGNTITSPIQIYADINTSYSSPVQLGTSSWVAVAAGKNNTFATRTGGSLFAWGNNTNGMLGQNNLVALSSPVQIGTSSWTSVSAGDEAAAAIRSDSALFTWGDSNLGQGGYLKGSALAVASYAASSPVQVGNNLLRYIVSPMQVGTSSWTQVAPNTYLTFAIKSDGTLWSWGSNDPAKLTQQTIATSSPTQIGTSSWTQISTTMSNNVAGILTNNTAYIWGENTFGQLGQSDRINRSSPVQVGPTGGVSKVCMAESAFYYLTNTGGLFSVGSNVDGKLGLNDSVANISSPVQVGTSSWTNIPGANSGGGADYMVAIRSDGTLFGWGNNGSGNLGINNRAHRSSPTQVGGQGIIIASLSSPIQIGTSSWTAISAGIYSSYAIRSDSGLFTWGDNTDGVLGDNTVIDKSSPVQVGTSSWTQIATTTIASAAAVAAIRSDGGLFTWGDNLVGQLGGNSITPKSSPVQVGTSSWTQVVVGANNMAGILADKSLYAWGSNASGQLGQSDRIHRSSPVQVGIEKNWLKIDIGQAEFLGIKTNNTLWGWGLNTSGQLGLNVANYRSSPTQVGTQKDWIQASLGSASAMAIKNSITKPSASYITTVGSGTAGAAQTFAATALGVATSNRIIVVATALLNAGAGDDVASVTIAGITATNAGNSVTGAVGASIWYAPVPTGETGTIVINLSDATTSVTAHVYALYNANSVAPYSTANNSVNASNITSSAYNTIINAVTIVVANTTAADTITFSSTGSGAITEGYDGFIVSSATRSTATAYIISTSNSSNITVTAQGGVTNNRTMVAATWL